MKAIMNTLEKEVLLRSICLFVFGLLALLIPEMLYKATIIIIVGFLAIMGLFNVVGALRTKGKNEPYLFPLLYSILLLILALIVYLYNKQLASLTVILIGIVLLLNGILDVFRYANGKEEVRQPANVLLIIGIIGIIAGVVVIINPFGSMIFLFRFVGFVLMAVSAGDVFFLKKDQVQLDEK